MKANNARALYVCIGWDYVVYVQAIHTAIGLHELACLRLRRSSLYAVYSLHRPTLMPFLADRTYVVRGRLRYSVASVCLSLCLCVMYCGVRPSAKVTIYLFIYLK